MKLRNVLMIVLVALVAVLPVAAEGQTEVEGSEDGPLLNEIGIQTQSNPAFATISVALEKEWFEEAGFENVNVMEFSSGNIAGEALIAGELSVWLPGNVPVINMRHNGLPVVVAGNMSVAYAEYLMIRDDADVQEPEDLYDIRIGLMQGSTASAVLEGIAEEHGLDMTRLNIVNLAPPEQVTALRNDEIQGLLVWPPSPFNVQDIASYSFNSKEFSHTRVPIVFNAAFVRNNRASARAITEVLYRSQEWVRANPEEAQEIHAEASEQPIDLVREMWDDYWGEGLGVGNLDQTMVDDYMAYTEFLQSRGAISGDTINILEYTYTDFVEDIDPNYVDIEPQWTP